jgi:hypothetical protein
MSHQISKYRKLAHFSNYTKNRIQDLYKMYIQEISKNSIDLNGLEKLNLNIDSI